MSLFSQKITLFLVLGLLIIGLGIPYAIYYSRRDVTGIGVGAIVVIMLVAGVAIALDRVAVRFAAPLWVSVVELGILIVALVSYSYSNRTVTLDLSANPAPYFVIIWTKYQPAVPIFQHRFPLDKVAVVPTGTVVLLNQETFPMTNVKVPTSWNGQFSRGIELTHPRYASAYFYGPENYLGKPAEVDSLLRQAVESAIKQQ